MAKRTPLTKTEPEVVAPPWAPTAVPPDPARYTLTERVIATRMAKLPPFSAFDPRWALPHARVAFIAMEMAPDAAQR